MVVDEKFLKDAGLVMEPQYNLDTFKPGTPIHVKGNGGKDPFYTFNRNCLVVKAAPLVITVVYVHEPRRGHEDEYSDTKTIEIPVKLVANQEVLITFLNAAKLQF